MARSDTRQFLDDILGTERGYVSVAYKQGERIWKEETYEWPAQRQDLVVWATKKAKTGDVFICPAVRIKKGRTKGEGKGLMWLWADVDMEKIESKKQASVRKRIEQMGTLVVSSGSGDNVHVYVRLEHEVTALEHEVLNTGLRDYLSADNKQADNSLLRLPGTINHKELNGPKGKPVVLRGGTGKTKDPEKLMALPTWKAVRINQPGVVSADWVKVDVSKLLKGSLKAMMEMPEDQAVMQHDSRYKAINHVVRKLIKRGLSSDEIHTLMDDYPAAVAKAEDERGYDVHKDIAKIMAHQPTADVVKAVMEEDEPESAEIPERVLDIMREKDYRRQADQLMAQRTFVAPPMEEVRRSLAHALAQPAKPKEYLIHGSKKGDKGLVGRRHTVLLTGQYKTGKTTFACNLARALADGTPFLDTFPVKMQSGNVSFWSCEMDPDEIENDYMRPQEIENPQRIIMTHLQGYHVNILTDVGKAFAVNSLREDGAKVWIIDSLAILSSMAGVSENDATEMGYLFEAIKQIKLAAGVEACFLIAHTGRAEMAEGAERARGSSAIEASPDSLWYLTEGKNGVKGVLFRVKGRGTKLDQVLIEHDDTTQRVTYAGFSNQAALASSSKLETLKQIVHDATKDGTELNKTDLKKLMRVRGLATNRETQDDLIDEALETGMLEETSTDPGRKNARKLISIPGLSTRMADFTDVKGKGDWGKKRRK